MGACGGVRVCVFGGRRWRVIVNLCIFAEVYQPQMIMKMKARKSVIGVVLASLWPVIAAYGSGDEDYEVWDVVTVCPEPVDTMRVAELPAAVDVPGTLSVCGESMVGVDALTRFVRSHNPDFDRRIAEAFVEVGRRYGIRGDVALCQSIVETGWFLFEGGTAVTPDQHNYCGLGVLKRGMKGHSFASIEEGVTAQIQHLYAYVTKKPLPRGERIVDPRFKLVRRGVASTWHDLSGRWAANSRYGEQILSLYGRLLGESQREKE